MKYHHTFIISTSRVRKYLLEMEYSHSFCAIRSEKVLSVLYLLRTSHAHCDSDIRWKERWIDLFWFNAWYMHFDAHTAQHSGSGELKIPGAIILLVYVAIFFFGPARKLCAWLNNGWIKHTVYGWWCSQCSSSLTRRDDTCRICCGMIFMMAEPAT